VRPRFRSRPDELLDGFEQRGDARSRVLDPAAQRAAREIRVGAELDDERTVRG
jgi:hypothetical protein